MFSLPQDEMPATPAGEMENVVMAVADAMKTVTETEEATAVSLKTDTVTIKADTVALTDSATHSELSIQHSAFAYCPRLALRTSLLYDLAMVPNIGVEWFAAEHWSVAANVMYIWTKIDTRHRYWRIFSTDVEGRYWLRPQVCNVYTGHHFGLYAGFYRYDMEFGGHGWMGDANYGGGISYGYALRLFPQWKEQLTLDMSIGFGYMGGTHKEYVPDDDCYVWERTMHHNLFIPTKAEVSLVWYPRWRFFNKKKGGGQ